ncbi:hypothetical protein BH09PSE1_BH09PSE1_30160 [soil metagenome]
MTDYQAHPVFRRTTMLAWLAVGGVTGLFWREVFDLAFQIF